MTTFNVTGALHFIRFDAHLDRLARSNDPYLRKRLEDELKSTIRGTGQPIGFRLTEDELKRFTRLYGEQYVADPCSDLNQYFDIVNGRFFSRRIPTQSVVLYLFGGGKQYRPNLGALSAAGEGLAGCCMEQFGYQPLVRPLGVMPDAVLWTRRLGRLRLALAEAKATTRQDPHRLLEENVAQFLVDIKTRATGFRYHYEGYLICSQFRDGHAIDCAVLHVDLECYCPSPAAAAPLDMPTTVLSNEEPVDRLHSMIRLQAETCEARDEYLTSLLSEEASRSATLALFKQGREPQGPDDVERYIRDTAAQLGLAGQWALGQELIKDVKGKEEDVVKHALQRYRKPEIDLEE